MMPINRLTRPAERDDLRRNPRQRPQPPPGYEEVAIVAVILPLGLSMMALHTGYNGLRDLTFARLARAESVRTLGTITGVSPCRPRVRLHCSFDYAFAVDGRTYHRHSYPGSDGPVGKRITITYMRSDPSLSNTGAPFSVDADGMAETSIAWSFACALGAIVAALRMPPMSWRTPTNYAAVAIAGGCYLVWMSSSLFLIALR